MPTQLLNFFLGVLIPIVGYRFLGIYFYEKRKKAAGDYLNDFATSFLWLILALVLSGLEYWVVCGISPLNPIPTLSAFITFFVSLPMPIVVEAILADGIGF